MIEFSENKCKQGPFNEKIANEVVACSNEIKEGLVELFTVLKVIPSKISKSITFFQQLLQNNNDKIDFFPLRLSAHRVDKHIKKLSMITHIDKLAKAKPNTKPKIEDIHKSPTSNNSNSNSIDNTKQPQSPSKPSTIESTPQRIFVPPVEAVRPELVQSESDPVVYKSVTSVTKSEIVTKQDEPPKAIVSQSQPITSQKDVETKDKTKEIIEKPKDKPFKKEPEPEKPKYNFTLRERKTSQVLLKDPESNSISSVLLSPRLKGTTTHESFAKAKQTLQPTVVGPKEKEPNLEFLVRKY